MNVIELAKICGIEPQYTRPQDSIVRKGYAMSGELKGYKASMQDLERFATLAGNARLNEAIDELKTQADYSGSNRRAFYMDAIEVLRKFKVYV